MRHHHITSSDDTTTVLLVCDCDDANAAPVHIIDAATLEALLDGAKRPDNGTV